MNASLMEQRWAIEKPIATAWRSVGWLAQAESPEERIVDFARHPETVVPLIASHSRSRFEAIIAIVSSHIIAILLQGQLDVPNGQNSAVAVVGGFGWIVITVVPVGGASVHRLRQTENRDDRKTEQSECFHIPSYGHAEITQITVEAGAMIFTGIYRGAKAQMTHFVLAKLFIAP